MSGSPCITKNNAELLTPRGRVSYLPILQHETDSTEQTKTYSTAVEESGNAEKPAESISSGNQDTPERSLMLSECCPKTKKQRQVLISQKLEKNLAVGKDAATPLDNAEAINLTTNGAVAEKPDEKCKFEEVEIKLEEMFAGIEDEQSVSNKDSQQNFKSVGGKKSTSNCEVIAAKEKPVSTKAANKSSDPAKDVPVSRIMKNLPPRRRLSIVNPALLEQHILMCNDKEQMLKDIGAPVNNSNISANATGNHTNMRKKNKPFGNKRKCFNENKKGKSQNSKQKKKIFTKTEDDTTKVESENEQDEKTQQTIDAKYRSPYVLIKNDGTINVVNTTTTDESSDKYSKTKRASFNVPERRNVRGIYSSTLSNKYDADTADKTWICVFCKRGPHRKGLGDLFGPYIIKIDNDEFKNAQEVRDRHIAAASIKRKRNDGIHNDTSSPVDGRHKSEVEVVPKADLNFIDDNGESTTHLFSGMTKMSSNTFEVWFHEDCTVWAPNLYLVGSRLVGLDSAILQSTFHTCVCCMRNGAIVCCLQRDCKETAHVPCAREHNWNLDESKFWAHCAKHHLSHLDRSIRNQMLLDKIKFPC